MTQELPSLRGEKLYVPFVGAIIERTHQGRTQVLLQTRQKSSDPIYNGSLEIVGGKMRAFEDIYETLRREVKEECGLEVISIEGESHRADFPNRGDVSTWIQPFCVTQMQNGPFIGIIFRCKAVGELATVTDEAVNARWVDLDELQKLVEKTPERVYTAFLAPLRKYLTIPKVARNR